MLLSVQSVWVHKGQARLPFPKNLGREVDLDRTTAGVVEDSEGWGDGRDASKVGQRVHTRNHQPLAVLYHASRTWVHTSEKVVQEGDLHLVVWLW